MKREKRERGKKIVFQRRRALRKRTIAMRNGKSLFALLLLEKERGKERGTIGATNDRPSKGFHGKSRENSPCIISREIRSSFARKEEGKRKYSSTRQRLHRMKWGTMKILGGEKK